MVNDVILRYPSPESVEALLGNSDAHMQVWIPLAALDAIEQEEFQCRRRFLRIASDFLHLCVARLNITARALRLMAREEAVRLEIQAFYRTWRERAVDLGSHNRRLVRILGRNVFRTRADYFSKWLKHALASRARNRMGAVGDGQQRNTALLKMEMRCVIYSVLRLPPTLEARSVERGASFSRRGWPSMDILSPMAEHTTDPDDARDLVRGESTLMVSLLRRWSSRITTRRKLAELEYRETAKRKLILMFEGAERARGGFH
jgi:hypothetical protein